MLLLALILVRLWHYLLAYETLLLIGVDIAVSDCMSCYYLRLGGYVFTYVCLFVSTIVQKLLNRFSQNSVERWHIGHERNY